MSENKPVSSRHVLSTHLLRATARRAADHYRKVQYRAFTHGDMEAQTACRDLGIQHRSEFKVERAGHQRAKWIVVVQ